MRIRSRAVCVGCLALVAAGCARRDGRSQNAAPSASSSVRPSAVSAPAPRFPAPPDVAQPPADAELTSSGVASRVLIAGQGGASPGQNDCVRVRYASWKRDGSFHSATTDDAAPTTQCLRRSLPGLAEVLERMSVGEERRIWVPGKLGYRSKDPQAPAPSDDLTFDLKLLEVLRAPEVPSDLRSPPASASKTRSGVRVQVLKASTGARPTLPNQRMSVRFSGWTEEGVLFESTEIGAGPPASLTRADVVRGVGEALSLMHVGERARAWVPAALAFGDTPRRGAPAGALVYDLELVALE